MIRRFIIALSLLGVSVSVATATETPNPAPEPSPTYGTGLYCVPVAQASMDSCGWEFEEGRYVDPRWINACAPECAGVNSRVQNQNRCEWKLLYDGATATPMFWQPTATPNPTETPPANEYTNCGQSLGWHDWEGAPGQCLSIKNPDDSWSSCAHTSGANRRSQLNVSYVWGGGLDGMKDIEDFVFNISPIPDIFSVTFRRCGQSEASCTLPANYITYTSGQYPDLLGMAINMDRVWGIDIRAESAPCGVFVCAPEDMPVYTLNSVQFCSSGLEFPPEATPTPTPTPSPTMTPTPEPDCARGGKGIHMDGVASAECQLYYPSEWDIFVNPGQNNPTDTRCDGAYFFSSNDPLPALYDDIYDTIWFNGVSYSAFCAPGLAYTFYVSETSSYQRVCQSSGWVDITHQIRPFPQIDNPVFRVGVTKLSNPSEEVFGTIDNLWVGYFDMPPCIDSGIQCYEPLYLDEIPAPFDGFNIVHTTTTCYTLIPELKGAVADTFGISYDGLSLCVDLYKFEPITFFSVSVDIMIFFRVALVAFIIKNIMTR